MIPSNSRQTAVLIIVFCLLPVMAVLAQEPEKHEEKPIQVVHTVSNHNYIEYPGGEFQLPRILLVNGHWYFYWNTYQAAQSDEFMMKMVSWFQPTAELFHWIYQ